MSLAEAVRAATGLSHPEGLAAFEERRAQAGTLLMRAGEPASDDALLLVLDGQVRVWVAPRPEPGAFAVDRIVDSGQLLGVLGAFGGGVRTANVEAVTAVRLAALPAHALRRLTARGHEARLEILDMLTRQLVRDLRQQDTLLRQAVQRT